MQSSAASLSLGLASDTALDPLAFGFAGVAFDVHPWPELRFQLDEEHRLFRALDHDGPRLARVHCAIGGASELADDYGREIRARWDGDVLHGATGGVRVEARDLGDGRFAATALVSPDARGCSSLLTALAGALAYRMGGLVLHASGVEVDGDGYLFIGPSGAGKTTAANHCPGARWFARDRAVVFRSSERWYAAGMCGGDPIELARADARVVPLRGILRVHRGEGASRIEALSALGALVALRESLQTVVSGPPEEQALADRMLALHAESRVGALRSVLGDDLVPTLGEWR